MALEIVLLGEALDVLQEIPESAEEFPLPDRMCENKIRYKRLQATNKISISKCSTGLFTTIMLANIYR